MLIVLVMKWIVMVASGLLATAIWKAASSVFLELVNLRDFSEV